MAKKTKPAAKKAAKKAVTRKAAPVRAAKAVAAPKVAIGELLTLFDFVRYAVSRFVAAKLSLHAPIDAGDREAPTGFRQMQRPGYRAQSLIGGQRGNQPRDRLRLKALRKIGEDQQLAGGPANPRVQRQRLSPGWVAAQNPNGQVANRYLHRGSVASCGRVVCVHRGPARSCSSSGSVGWST